MPAVPGRSTLAIVGAGYVGLASALSFAHVGHRVRLLDRDGARIAMLQEGRDPLGEPHVDELLAGTNIEFTTDPKGALSRVDAIVVAVGTPNLPAGSVDLSQLEGACLTISENAPASVVLIRSTVPVGTGDRLQAGLLRRFVVVSNPEFLREGTAITDSLRPTRILAGGDPDAEAFVRGLYRPIEQQVFQPLGDLAPGRVVPLFWTDRRTAELAKYAANAFLVTKLSFVNEIANLSAALGADVRQVLQVVGADPRIGSSFLRPGLGWGGSCFPKDTRALLEFALTTGYEFSILRAVVEQNNAQLLRFFHSILRGLDGIPGPRIGLLGLAFKSGTGDCRESPAVALAQLLLERGFDVQAYDPAVSHLPSGLDGVRLCGSLQEVAQDADAIVIATEWPEFATADYADLRAVMRGDQLFDGRCIVDPDRARVAGLRYRGVCPPPDRD